jgi:DNA mismatch repair protein MutL
MNKIRVLSDQLVNQIAAGEVVERPASVAKELVENSIDAGAQRIQIDVELGGRRLLRVTDDGEGMTRDDAMLAFERHATSKISTVDDLAAIATLGFRGEALASIASVARVELATKQASDAAATKVIFEGGRLKDVKDAAHPKGTTIAVRDLFFNVPARRKFLRSEATENYHLTNLVTHYALAHPEIAFTLTNNGRETLRVAPARDLRERAYQIFGSEFVENLLAVDGGLKHVAWIKGFVSAPRERRTSRDAQYLFINGRFVRDKLIGRALTESYRSVLPHGVYPVALLFLEVPLEEIDVNVHPQKTEVRFRRVAAVNDAVREAVRGALVSAGFVRESDARSVFDVGVEDEFEKEETSSLASTSISSPDVEINSAAQINRTDFQSQQPIETETLPPQQTRIEFGFERPTQEVFKEEPSAPSSIGPVEIEAPIFEQSGEESFANIQANEAQETAIVSELSALVKVDYPTQQEKLSIDESISSRRSISFPPLDSASALMREVPIENLSTNIRPLGQLENSFIIATDDEGLLVIDQHVAHERVLFDKYSRMMGERKAESQRLLIPETFDLTPAQAAAFDLVHDELELYGFGLLRLSGRTVAINAVPADLPASEARNMLAEVLDTVDAEKRGSARATWKDEIAASLACRAAIKVNMVLTTEKMRWLIDSLLLTSSPTTCPHGRPIILRLTIADIEKGFHRT